MIEITYSTITVSTSGNPNNSFNLFDRSYFNYDSAD